ncbi:DUF2235 domain-containing protein [Billgrantia bachuensis]|uniref:DUF2235 domain-containing protein n=1 Tax=Billgrantia bachuensis TaxID=2717286 RepID=A0ABX0PPK4_9GAMM|nr:DUF2235 domain-containing protein [Halomonas bachuensis]NIC04859.1 DUF2235 domain-containing protein [Halomonas bachuensis]
MKRIVICADGTWQCPESDTATHVLRLARGIAPCCDNDVKQIVYYDWGVGVEGDSILGGATGAGIDKNIMDCYRFIVHNYEPGDQLFLFGFSRGAYIVRSLAGLIRNCGVLLRLYADRIPEAYQLYRQRARSSAPGAERSIDFRCAYAVADITPIEFLGVWDTVGALGIPAPFLGTLGTERYLFHDTEPSSIIRHARHAVSIDENRQDFEPTLWSAKPGIDLKQVWFAGVHTDIGGGYPQRELGDYAGQWMVTEAERCGLALEPHFVASMNPRHSGRQHDEYKGFYKIMRRSQYRTPEPCLHQSVRLRWEDPHVTYQSPALSKLLDSVDGDWDKVELVG